MKFSLIVAVVVLALAQGSFAQEVTDLERLGQYFEEMKNKMTLELTEIINKQDLASQAQNIQTQLEPLAAQIQEQLKTVATNVEEQIKPMATEMQAQIQPMVDNFQKQVEAIFQKLTEQARAIGN
ncbi:type-4 ice-structuring protein LS-12-like [Morone saxatilis]|uniref:type-4 ice-structuring protein LS-12-like n=1 Tax=Morone saxatilis TaxID=34816 RepID=UPI0015E20F97|nr:type-4 ice-structuring protein LS-12-like [Morone saxatilis]